MLPKMSFLDSFDEFDGGVYDAGRLSNRLLNNQKQALWLWEVLFVFCDANSRQLQISLVMASYPGPCSGQNMYQCGNGCGPTECFYDSMRVALAKVDKAAQLFVCP